MISCRYATSMHTDEREGALGGVRRALYRFHLNICPHCKAYHAGLEQTGAALENLEKERAPDALKAAVAERLRARAK